jgi:ABC-type sugar transport system substrate-binding protein
MRMVLEQFETTPNIFYQGQVSPGEAQRVIGGASLLLSTSDLEGLPNTFLHAWGAGVPVVAVGLDPGQAIAASGGGIVAANPAEGAQAIRSLQDREANQRLGQKGYAYIQAVHGEEAAVARLLAALADDRL